MTLEETKQDAINGRFGIPTTQPPTKTQLSRITRQMHQAGWSSYGQGQQRVFYNPEDPKQKLYPFNATTVNDRLAININVWIVEGVPKL